MAAPWRCDEPHLNARLYLRQIPRMIRKSGRRFSEQDHALELSQVQVPAFSAFSISRFSTLSILSGVIGPTSLNAILPSRPTTKVSGTP